MPHTNFRNIGLGILAVAAILAVGGCSGSNSMTGGGGGNVQFVLSAGTTTTTALPSASPTILHDDQGRQIDAAVITLSSVLARNLDGELVDVTIDLPAMVDLIALSQGGTVELPMGSLPPGSYDQLVIVIRSLNVTLSDGTQIAVTPPGGGWTAIVPTAPFDVAEGTVTTVQLHFRMGGAFRWIDGGIEFDPEFDCHVGDHDD